MAPKSTCSVDATVLGQMFSNHNQELLAMNGTNQVKMNVGLCKGLLTKIAKKTTRLNKTQVDKGLRQAGFAEPKRSALSGMLYNSWHHCLVKSRNMTTGLHLSQAEKQVVLAMRALRNETEAAEAEVSKAKGEVKQEGKKQKIMPKEEDAEPEPMIKHA